MHGTARHAMCHLYVVWMIMASSHIIKLKIEHQRMWSLWQRRKTHVSTSSHATLLCSCCLQFGWYVKAPSWPIAIATIKRNPNHQVRCSDIAYDETWSTKIEWNLKYRVGHNYNETQELYTWPVLVNACMVELQNICYLLTCLVVNVWLRFMELSKSM